MSDLQLARAMSEAELQANVAGLCAALKLPHFHVLNSVGMTRGWPDSVIIGRVKILYRELKDERKQPTPEQRAIGYAIIAAGGDWALWRPRDWLSRRIERELRLVAGQPQLPLTG